MEITASYEIYAAAAFTIFVIVLAISYFYSLRLDKLGIRQLASVNSITVEEIEGGYSDDTNTDVSYTYKASVSYTSVDGQPLTATISIPEKKRPVKKNGELPIIYWTDKPTKPRFDNSYYIYRIPIILVILFILSIIIISISLFFT